jgi:hypothetical protein
VAVVVTAPAVAVTVPGVAVTAPAAAVSTAPAAAVNTLQIMAMPNFVVVTTAAIQAATSVKAPPLAARPNRIHLSVMQWCKTIVGPDLTAVPHL